MRKLIGFELGKLLRNKILWVLIVVLLAVNIVDVWSPWVYERDHRFINGMSVPFFKELRTKPQQEQNEILDYLRRLYAAGVPLPEEQQKKGKYLPTIGNELTAGMNLMFMDNRNDKTTQARSNIVSSARWLGRDALEAGDAYNIRKNLVVIDTYSADPHLDFMPEIGWERYFTRGLSDILVLLLVAAVVATCFSNEQEIRASMILSTCKNGQGKLAAAKLTAAGLTAFGLSALFTLANLVMFYFKYGIWSISNPLCELESFMSTPLLISVGQYLLIFLLFKAFGAVIFSLIVCLISALCDSNLKAYVISAAFLGLSYGYSFLLSQAALPEVLRFADVTLWTRPLDYFGKYYTANLFGFPVQWFWLHLIFGVLLAAAVCFLTVRAYIRKPQQIK